MNKEIRKFWTYLIWSIIIILMLIFHFVASKNKMPYDDWLMNNFSVWLAVLNVIVICLSFFYFAIPRKQRSLKLSFIIASVAGISSIPLKISVQKIPLIINIFVIIVMYTLFFFLRSYLKNRQIDSEHKK